MEPQQNPQPNPLPPTPPIQPSSPSTGTPTSRPAIVWVGFFLAFLIPLAGLVVSIIARQKVSKESLPGKGLATAGIVISSAFTFISLIFLVLMVWFIAALGGFHGNGAQSASKPLMTQIEQAGGKKICTNGDSGYGIDNTTPWYEVYYEIPDSPQLTDKIKNIAASQGYQLQTDTQAVNQLKEDSQYALPGDEQYNPKTNYLTGKSGGDTLTIQINRQTEVALSCDTGQYGRKQKADNGTAIMDVSFSLPETNR